VLKHGDCRLILPTLPAGSVRCVVTSPPYWGLRDYGTARFEGGDPECPHIVASRVRAEGEAGRGSSTLVGTTDTMRANEIVRAIPKDICKCGARRIDAQLGLERTPEEYVAALVGVFREVRRVLADDGTLWLNLGDSYAGSGRGIWNVPDDVKTAAGIKETYRPSVAPGRDFHDKRVEAGAIGRNWVAPPPGLKNKDLVGIPWRVAFALQADGWYLRSDIIWSKPNPMPESVTDRPTKAHEYVFLLSKSAAYYYDADAISEPSIYAGKVVTNDNGKNGQMGEYGATRGGFLKPEGVTVKDTRNARSVWTIPTQPTPDAHFATFPEELAHRCVAAGSAAGDTVMDPFFGSGTVGKVAERLGRKWIGIELSEDYVKIAKRKTAQIGLYS
jgi:DNA modification methylase